MNLLSQTRDFITGTEVINGVPTLKGFEAIFNNVLVSVLGFAGIGFFIMLIVGGTKFITAANDPKAAEAAKSTITAAVAGIVVIATSYLVIKFIETFTGANLSTFQINI